MRSVRLQFLTGGIVRESPMGLNRCNSDTDSIVWMKEDKLTTVLFMVRLFPLVGFYQGFLRYITQ